MTPWKRLRDWYHRVTYRKWARKRRTPKIDPKPWLAFEREKHPEIEAAGFGGEDLPAHPRHWKAEGH